MVGVDTSPLVVHIKSEIVRMTSHRVKDVSLNSPNLNIPCALGLPLPKSVDRVVSSEAGKHTEPEVPRTSEIGVLPREVLLRSGSEYGWGRGIRSHNRGRVMSSAVHPSRDHRPRKPPSIPAASLKLPGPQDPALPRTLKCFSVGCT